MGEDKFEELVDDGLVDEALVDVDLDDDDEAGVAPFGVTVPLTKEQAAPYLAAREGLWGAAAGLGGDPWAD
jgi:hypothetical protein